MEIQTHRNGNLIIVLRHYGFNYQKKAKILILLIYYKFCCFSFQVTKYNLYVFPIKSKKLAITKHSNF